MDHNWLLICVKKQNFALYWSVISFLLAFQLQVERISSHAGVVQFACQHFEQSIDRSPFDPIRVLRDRIQPACPLCISVKCILIFLKPTRNFPGEIVRRAIRKVVEFNQPPC
jgi:hypothetical protein